MNNTINKDEKTIDEISFVTEPFAKIGGCQMQLLSWKEVLVRSGFNVNFSMDVSKSKLIHFFPIENPTILNQLRLRSKAKSIVSTNYWSKNNYYNLALKRISLELPSTIKKNLSKIMSYSNRYELFNSCDRIIANTKKESELLCYEYGINNNKISIIPNTVKDVFLNTDISSSKITTNPYLLTIASIDPRKNQHLVAAIAKRMKYDYRIYGPVYDESYLNYVLKIGGGYVHYCGTLVHGSKEMLNVLDSSSLYILPSWWETPGISAMEAAVRGKPIIVTEIGGAREYFGDYAQYTNGQSLYQEQIENCLSLDEKYLFNKSKELKVKFSSSSIADLLINAYKIALI